MNKHLKIADLTKNRGDAMLGIGASKHLILDGATPVSLRGFFVPEFWAGCGLIKYSLAKNMPADSRTVLSTRPAHKSRSIKILLEVSYV